MWGAAKSGALGNGDVRRILAAAAVSQIGDWAARLALAFIILEKTGLASGVGVAGALFFLPWLGPGQYLARFGDRVNRVRLLAACELSRAVLYGLVAIGAAVLPAWILLAAIAVIALIDPVWESNRSALIVDVTTKEEYPSAIKAVHSVNQAATLVGWAVGGFLVTWIGTGGALAVNAATFMVSALLISGVASQQSASSSTGDGSFTTARRFLTADPLVGRAVATAVGLTLFGMAIETQAPVYGTYLGFSENWIGLMIAVIPLVTFLSVLLIPTKLSDPTLLRVAFGAGGISGLAATLLFAVGGADWLTFVAYGCVGAAFAASLAANVVVGRRLPDVDRAAIFSIVQGAIFGAFSVGALVGGLVSDLVSIPGMNVIFAFGIACTGFVGAASCLNYSERQVLKSDQ